MKEEFFENGNHPINKCIPKMAYTSRAKPKSVILQTRARDRRMLRAARSRWTILLSAMYRIPDAICAAYVTASRSYNR